MGGDRGGGKKGGKRGIKGGKKHPLGPSLVSSGGQAGEFQKTPQGRSENILLLPCAWAARPNLAATPTGSTGCVPVGSSLRLPSL
jgi:hypothetical protein